MASGVVLTSGVSAVISEGWKWNVACAPFVRGALCARRARGFVQRTNVQRRVSESESHSELTQSEAKLEHD